MCDHTLEKIVANPETDGVFLVLEGGKLVVAFPYNVWGGSHQDVKENFLNESCGGTIYGVTSNIGKFSDELEHDAAVVLFTAGKGWTV